MAVTVEKIQKLREKTLASMSDVKKALEETAGDEEKALEILKKRGKIIADKKSARETKAGLIASYIHSNGKVGALLELKCETDFVAQNEEFKSLAHDLALHITAMNPKYLKPEDVPQEVIEKEKSMFKEQTASLNKPANVVEQIIDGKLNKYFDENCLLNQKFVKNDEKSVKDLIVEYVAKIGENIEIGKFARFEI